MHRASVLLLFPAVLVGCGPKTPKSEGASPSQTAAAPTPGTPITGSVAERLEAPPYLYLRLKTASGEVWAAVPAAQVENGATVTVYGAMPMGRFESKTLKRTFDQIYFGTLTASGGMASVHGGGPTRATVVAPVAKAGGPEARTIAEAWAQKASLTGKTIAVRGVVVKYNPEVMGKNWIHLQDGSGDASQGTNDLAVTSLDAAAVGDTITVRGTVRTDRDFGAGYAYAIIVEDAKVTAK